MSAPLATARPEGPPLRFGIYDGDAVLVFVRPVGAPHAVPDGREPVRVAERRVPIVSLARADLLGWMRAPSLGVSR